MNSAEFLADNPYARFGNLAIDATVDARRTFIRKTYAHLTVAIYGLVLIEFLYFKTLPLDNWVPQLFASAGVGWRCSAATWWSAGLPNAGPDSSTSLGTQYAGLCRYVVAFSVILCPMLWIANHFCDPDWQRDLQPDFGCSRSQHSPFSVC